MVLCASNIIIEFKVWYSLNKREPFFFNIVNIYDTASSKKVAFTWILLENFHFKFMKVLCFCYYTQEISNETILRQYFMFVHLLLLRLNCLYLNRYWHLLENKQRGCQGPGYLHHQGNQIPGGQQILWTEWWLLRQGEIW